MATQEERRTQTRQKIVNAAAELFLKNGFDNTSIEQIVAQANVVKGIFYQHFQTKMDLLVVVGRKDEADRVRNLIEQVEQGASALDVLQRWLMPPKAVGSDSPRYAPRLYSPNPKFTCRIW